MHIVELATGYDAVVCNTGFAAEEFDRIGARNVLRVDLECSVRRDDDVAAGVQSNGRVVFEGARGGVRSRGH
jgi:hypothetical protein